MGRLDRFELRERGDLPGYGKNAGGVQEGEGGRCEAGAESVRKEWHGEGSLMDQDKDCAGNIGCEDLVDEACL